MKNFIKNYFNRKRWFYLLPYVILILIIAFFIFTISLLFAKEDRVIIYPKKGLKVAIIQKLRGKESGDLLRTFSEYNQKTGKNGEFVIYKLSIKNTSKQTVSFYNPEVFSNHIEFNGLGFTDKSNYSFFPFINFGYDFNFLEIKPFNIENRIDDNYPTLPEVGEWQSLFPTFNIVDIEPGQTREGCIIFDKDIEAKINKGITRRSNNTIFILNTFYLPFGAKPAK